MNKKEEQLYEYIINISKDNKAIIHIDTVRKIYKFNKSTINNMLLNLTNEGYIFIEPPTPPYLVRIVIILKERRCNI